ncbi:Mitochondrial import inner membrane translocase subunit Tim21 [Dinochytrium kinnereticum]|nr:Mitochondrial import inner membrane translocase subunit Tim21 [Dinochytrium kinnereticum]
MPRRHYSEVVRWSDMSLGQKGAEKNRLVHTTKNAGYLGVILFGVTVFGTALTFTGFNLVEDWRVNSTLEEAMERIKDNDKALDHIGMPMEAVGDMMGPRGRASRLHRHFYKDAQGYERLKMRFYVRGPISNGTVNLEKYKNDDGEWVFDHLYLDVEGNIQWHPKYSHIRPAGRRRPRIAVIQRKREQPAGDDRPKAGGAFSSFWRRPLLRSRNKEDVYE